MNSRIHRTEDVRFFETVNSTATDRVELNIPGFSLPLFLVAFTPQNAPENLWAVHFTLSEVIFREFNQRGRLPNRDAVRRRLSISNPLYTVKRWLVFDGAETAVAYASLSFDTELSPDYESSSHIFQVNIQVTPSHRRRKIATHILKYMVESTGAMERETVRADTDNSTGADFCRHLKGERVHREVQHRLYLEDVDWQLAKDWLRKGRARSRLTTMEFFQDCPEKDIDEFCRIYTEIINQRPVGDTQEALITTPESRRIEERNFRRRGIEWHTMICREHDNQISGITDIMFNPEEPYQIHQYFTGVLGKYRRRGLAKLLKSEMLVYIKEQFPDAEYITTTTAKENKPMRAINKQLGFMPKKTYTMFQWPLNQLEKRVNRVLSVSDRRTKD